MPPKAGPRWRRLTAALVAAWTTTTGAAWAGPARLHFDIPARPLGEALLAFSLAAHEQVIVSPAVVAGRLSRPLKGDLPPDLALARLLEGSGLEARRTARGVLMIGLAPRPSDRPAPTPLPRLDVEPTEVEALVVTIQQREQREIETPLALSTFSGETLDRLGVAGMDQLSRLVPGLSVVAASPATAGFSMRGITQASGDATREPRMSVFQDGLSVSKERGAYFELFDVERIDVAKGPQSTLFGRSAMTGALNVVQRKADPGRAEARARIDVGAYGLRTYEGMANLPLGKYAAVRFAGRSRRLDGVQTNLAGGGKLDGQATDAARVALSWAPDPRVRADLIVNYQRDRPDGVAMKSLVFAPTDPVSGRPLGDLGRFTPAALSVIDEAGAPAALGLDRTLSSGSALVSYAPTAALKISLIGGYRRFAADERQDADAMSLPVVSLFEQTRGIQHSEELRVNYDAGGRWSGFAGLSAFRESGTQRVPITIDERLLMARITGRMTQPFPQSLATLTAPGFLADQLQSLAYGRGYGLDRATALAIAANLKPAYVERNQNFSETTAYDAYGDLTLRPSPSWKLSAGVRYSFDRKRSGVAPANPGGPLILGSALAAFSLAEPQRAAFLAALAQPGAGQGLSIAWPNYGLIFQPTPNGGEKVSRGLEDGGLSWRLVARYAASADLNLYASYARGRRPTVLVAGAPERPEGAARFGVVPAETVDSVEVGLKADLLDRGLLVSAATYGYAYKDFQTTQMINGQLRTVNAGQANAVGVEGQADVALAPGARLIASYAYNHARLASGAMKGNHFRLAPDHKVSLALIVSHDAPGGRLTFSPSYAWQSKIFFSDENDRPDLSRGLARDTVQDEFQDGYGLLDLRLNYRPTAGDWDVTAFATNALNRRYIREAGFIGESFGFSAAGAGPPRVVGLSFTARH